MSEERVISVETSSTGGGVGYSTGALTGEIISLQYEPDATNPFATTMELVVSLEKTGQKLLETTVVDAAFIRAPMQPAHSQAGAQLTFSSGAPLSPLVRPIVAVNDRVKVAVEAGGAGKVGSFRITAR